MKINDIIKKILNILLPQKCLSCRQIGEIICDDCLSKLPRESNVYGITTLFSYCDPTVRKAIWLLKYKGGRVAARPLAKAVQERLLEDLSSISEFYPESGDKIVIVPVPLSKEREKERGFNQSELLAREIANLDNGESFEVCANALMKIKNTPTQVAIKNKTERMKNLRGAFVLKNTDDIKNKIVILLDDVTTTGATLNECARILRRAKPRRIIKVAIAH